MKPPKKNPFKKNSTTISPMGFKMFNGLSMIKPDQTIYNNKDIIKYNNDKMQINNNYYSSIVDSKLVKKYQRSKYSLKIGGGGASITFKQKF